MVKGISILFILISFLGFAQDVEVKELKTELKNSTYSPTYYQEKLVVTCHQKNSIAKTIFDDRGFLPANLYLVNLENENKISEFDPAFSSPFNDGPIAISEDGTYAIVSRNLDVNSKVKSFEEQNNRLGLFESYRNPDGTWGELVELPFNSIDFINSHPAIYEENGIITLVFASNRPNGYGGNDLWWAEKVNGKWSEPENFGAEINSKANEVFPTFVGDNLYFSSDLGKEDLDIYWIPFNQNKAEKTKLKEPFNSSFDDFGLISKNSGSSGFLCSNRNGEDAIFEFKHLLPEFEFCEPQVNDVFCYTLYEEYAAEIGEVPSLVYEWTINDEKLRGVEVDYCFPGEGYYEINLDIIDTIVNQVYSNQANYQLNLTKTIQPFINCYDSIQVSKPTRLDAFQSHLPDVSEKKYFWIIDGTTLLKGEQVSHTFKTKGDHEILLGIEGIKDGQPFKQCVTKNVVVVSKKSSTVIYAEKLEEGENATINGETYSYEKSNDSTFTIYSVEVISSDEEIDTTSEAIRELMQDYEVRLDYIESTQQHVLLVGQFVTIDDAYQTWSEIQNKGFAEAIVITFLVENYNEISLNKNFKLDQLYFDVGSSELKDETKAELVKVATVMSKFPFLSLEIMAHTDNTGDHEYNIKLSIDRANAIKTELINLGIDESRINAIGFGETEPIAENDTEEGRKQNRRVEFKLYVP